MRRWLVFSSLVLAACGSSSSDDTTDGSTDDSGVTVLPDGRVIETGHDTSTPPGDTPPGDTTTPPTDTPLPAGSARELAVKLRGKGNFMIGMGNDLADDHSMDGVYTLGVTMDLHYAYLVGLPGAGGWPDWNSDASGAGAFVNVLADPAKSKGVTPMFTLYAMAAWGDGNTSTVTDDAFMKPYWEGAKLLFQRVGSLGVPTVVHMEPDWWGYCQQFSKGDPKNMPVHVTAHVPECAGLPDDIGGMGHCLIKLARTYAPNAFIGFGVSEWADGDPSKIVAFHKALGADTADMAVVETLDRDAGCFEAAVDPNCKRGGSFYWDESNATSPNFHEHLAYAKAIHDGLNKPLVWWQTPFGVPSSTPGGTAGHYRDNRVHYMFAHIDEFVAAGGAGITFGTGAGNQTYIDSDGGRFKDAVMAYFASPAALP
jgi:hypothetical protein